MNEAIIEGRAPVAPHLAAGLPQWPSGHGTPGSDTHAGAGGTFVPAD